MTSTKALTLALLAFATQIAPGFHPAFERWCFSHDESCFEAMFQWRAWLLHPKMPTSANHERGEPHSIWFERATSPCILRRERIATPAVPPLTGAEESKSFRNLGPIARRRGAIPKSAIRAFLVTVHEVVFLGKTRINSPRARSRTSESAPSAKKKRPSARNAFPHPLPAILCKDKSPGALRGRTEQLLLSSCFPQSAKNLWTTPERAPFSPTEDVDPRLGPVPSMARRRTFRRTSLDAAPLTGSTFPSPSADFVTP